MFVLKNVFRTINGQGHREMASNYHRKHLKSCSTAKE